MDNRPRGTFEPEDFNPLGEPDPEAVAQAGQNPFPEPPPPAEFPAGAGGGALPNFHPGPPGAPQFEAAMEQMPPPLADQMAGGQFPAQPPASPPVDQFSSPMAPGGPPLAPPDQVNQFGSPMAPGGPPPAAPGQVNQFGSPMDPGAQSYAGPMPDYSTPGQGRIGTPGAVSATEQVKNWNADRVPGPNVHASRAVTGGLVAVVAAVGILFLGAIAGPITAVVSLLVAYVAAFYAIVQGHQGMREARRSAGTGKGSAVAGLVMGYGSSSLVTIGVGMAVLAAASYFSLDSSLQDAVEPPAAIDEVQPVSQEALAPGDCLLAPNDTLSRYGGDDWSFQIVDCGSAHRAEVVFVDSNPAYSRPTGSGTEAIDLRCDSEAAIYMGAAASEGFWFSEYYFPAEPAWQSGNGYVVCTVEVLFYVPGRFGG